MKKAPLLLLLAATLSAPPVFAQNPAPPLRPEDEPHRPTEAVSGRTPSFKGVPLAVAVGAAKPAPEPPAKPALKKAKGPTEIDALEATFDQKANQAVFIGEVVVKDPEFNVKCDKLTAHLKSAEKPPAAAGAAEPKPAAPAATATKKSGGLQKAIAEANPGSRVLITQDKKDADGAMQHSEGEADKATYDAVTGDIVLTGKPEIQQGINRVIATAPHTVMTLNRDGHMNAKGPHKTIIVDKASGGL